MRRILERWKKLTKKKLREEKKGNKQPQETILTANKSVL